MPFTAEFVQPLDRGTGKWETVMANAWNAQPAGGIRHDLVRWQVVAVDHVRLPGNQDLPQPSSCQPVARIMPLVGVVHGRNDAIQAGFFQAVLHGAGQPQQTKNVMSLRAQPQCQTFSGDLGAADEKGPC